MEEQINRASLVTKKLRPSDKCEKSNALYMQVIEKNFQTINDLLKKLNLILSKHDEFEYEINSYSKRLSKIQADMENIHNQHRRESLNIYSNIQNLKQELSGIDTHIQLLYNDYRKKGLLSLINNKKNYRNQEDSDKYLFSESQSQNVIDESNKDNDSNTFSSHQKYKNKFMYSDSIAQKLSEQSDKTGQNQSNKFLKLGTNMSSNNLSPITQTQKLKRKSSIQKKKTMRKSLDEKLQTQSYGMFLAQPINKQKESQNAIKATLLRKSVNINNQSQNFECQQEDQCISKIQKVKESRIRTRKQKIQSIRKSILSQNKNQSSNIINFVTAQFAKVDHNKQKITTDQFESYLKLSLQQQKIQQIDKKIYEVAISCLKNDQQIRGLYIKFMQIGQKCTTFVNNQKFSEDLFGLMKEINKLRQSCHQNFANKSQTKKAFLFMENKIKNTSQVMQIRQNFQQFGFIVSKCLGCNRPLTMENETTAKRSISGCKTSESSLQKKISINQLKKKTIQLMKKGKMRTFDKNN